MLKKCPLCQVVAAGGLLAPIPVFAAVSDNFDMEEVVVTATRRAEGVQDIPYNITAVTGDNLREVGATDMTKMSQFVPGMQMVDTGGRDVGLVTLRGMNVGALEASENQGGKDVISRYINDSPLLIDFKLIDIERVEVLRGPQGTLYGRGAMGGTLRYILKKPELGEFNGEVYGKLYSVTYADDTSYEVNGIVNIPLGDQVALRLSGGYLDDSGFVDYSQILTEPGVSPAVTEKEDVNDEETSSLRASLRWEPTEKLYLQANYYLQDIKAGGRQAVNEDFTGSQFESALRYEEPANIEDQLVNLEISWETEYVTLFTTNSWAENELNGQRDQTDLLVVDISPSYADFMCLPPFEDFSCFSAFTDEEESTDAFVHETRLLSTGEGNIDWILGFYYEDEEDRTSSKEFTPGYQEFAGLDTGFGELEFWDYNRTDFEETALFGEVTWHISSEWQLTLGARAFEQEEKIHYACTVLPNLGDVANADRSTCPSNKADVDDEVFKFNTSYDFTDEVMAYLTVAEGFRRGGANSGPTTPNINAFLSPSEARFDSDKVTNYEIGWHTEWGDGVIFNGAVFLLDWEDIQVPTKSAVGGLNIIQNASEGEITGLELSTQFFPLDNLRLDAWLTFYDHGLTQDAPEVGGFDDDEFPGVPDVQYNVAAEWIIPNDIGNVTLRGNLYYRDDIDTRLNSEGVNNDNETLDDYTVVNLSATVEKDSWRLTIYADNVTDEYYSTGARGEGRYGIRGQFRYVGAPRTIGLEAGYRF